MLAVTIDLVLAIAAVSVVAALWFQRRALKPQSVWEKLTVGATMVAFALIVRLADSALTHMPWPILADPAVQAIVIAIGLIGGALAVAAGLADWIPGLVAQSVAGRWRHEWSRSQRDLIAELRDCDQPGRIVAALETHLRSVCATPRVAYCAYQQRAQQFTNWHSDEPSVPRRWQPILNDLSNTHHPVATHTKLGTMLAIPVEVDGRLYGAVIIERENGHPALAETHLLNQTADHAALALHNLAQRALAERERQVNATVEELSSMLGEAPSPVDDLMAMLELAHREMAVEYASVLIFEGDRKYAQRFSHYWNGQRLSERGLHVPLGKMQASELSSRRAYVTDRGAAVMSSAAIPHPDMRFRLAVPLLRGTHQVGLIAIASLTHSMRLEQIDLLTRWAPAFATAAERITLISAYEKSAARINTLGQVAADGSDTHRELDRLTTEILDEIPGTFCQYMTIAPERNIATVAYRRTRREGWGNNTLGMEFDLRQLPTFRMVIETGRSMLFRQDDPERHFESQEADQVFGAIPNSLLLIPVLQSGICRAVMAVGEMREPNRNTYTATDRTFADSYVRLCVSDRSTSPASTGLDAFGDLNFKFAGPLTGILGSVEILRQQVSKEDPQAKYLNVIERNADRIKGAVTQLAEFQHAAVPTYVRRQTETRSQTMAGQHA